MKISDIDKKLDKRIILKVKQNTELFHTTSKLDIKLPSYVYGMEGTSWISTYFPKNLKANNVLLFLDKFKAVEREESYVIDSRINNKKDLAIIGKFMELPSFIINRADISSGFLNVYARFHHSQMNEVSKLLSLYTEDKENSRVEWLGPTRGIMKAGDVINSEYPISLITCKIELTQEDENLKNVLFEPETMGELKSSEEKNGMMKAVIYTDHRIIREIDGLIPVSEDDFIYELSFTNQLLKEARDLANDNHIMRIRSFIRESEGKIHFSVFVPRANIYELSSLIFDLAREHDGEVQIENLMPYSPDVWDLI